MNSDLEIQKFNIREASWPSEKNVLTNLRRLVFTVEQNFPGEQQTDVLDQHAWHWLAADNEDRPIGTIRLLKSGQIELLAILEQFRGHSIGTTLLEHAIEKARHLGLTSVYLDSKHELCTFFERSGFSHETTTSDTTDNQRMKKALKPLLTTTQRKLPAGPAPDVSIRRFDTAEAGWSTHRQVIRSLRRTVLVNEIGLADGIIEDEQDPESIHFCSQTRDGQLIGVLRMDHRGNISRLAVDSGFRREGIGFSLLEAALGKAQRFGLSEVRLPALAALDGFYTNAKFMPRGPTFVEQGLEHQVYFRTLDEANVVQPVRQSSAQALYTEDSGEEYRLGTDKRLVLLRRESEFRRVLLEMCSQATHSIRILSPFLDHKLFDSEEMREICSSLARRNKYTFVEILLFDSHRVVKNGHALLEISRRLSSSIKIKIVHPELRTTNNEYVLVDGEGFIYRQNHEIYEGCANFRDVTENNRLGRQFLSGWESGLQDPNLRQLKI